MRRAWTAPVLLLIVGAGVVAGSFVRGRGGTGVVLLVVFVLLAGATSPLVFPRSVGAVEARRRGCRTLDGGGMAVFQAVGAFRQITGLEPDAARMLAHFRAMTG